MRQSLLFLCFFLFRLVLAAPAMRDPGLALRINPDAIGYHALGVNMAENNAFSRASSPPYGPDGLRTPLYPLLVGVSEKIIGDPIRPVVILQALLWALVGIGLFAFMERRYGHAAGFTSTLFVLTSPLGLKYGPALMSENLFVAVLVASALVFFRARDEGSLRLFALSGLLLGLSVLVRPSSLPLGVLLIFLVGRPFLKRGLVLLGLWAAPIGMWVMRNWLTFGFPFFSNVFPLNLIFQHAPMVIAMSEGITLQEANERVANDLMDRYRADETWFYDPEKLSALTPYGLKVIRNHPGEYAALYIRGVLVCFWPSDPGSLGASLGLWREAFADQFSAMNMILLNPARTWGILGEAIAGMGLAERLLLVFILAHTLSLYIMAIVGAVRLRRDRVFLAVCLLSVAVLVLIIGVSGSPRFRLPAEPFLALLAGGAFLRRGAPTHFPRQFPGQAGS